MESDSMKEIKPNWYESPVSFTKIEKIEKNWLFFS